MVMVNVGHSSLNCHRSFDVCKLVDALRRGRCELWMLLIFNISLIGRVDALGLNGALWSTVFKFGPFNPDRLESMV